MMENTSKDARDNSTTHKVVDLGTITTVRWTSCEFKGSEDLVDYCFQERRDPGSGT